jgi:DNA-binding MarR family transcriptional regulator
MIRTNRKSSSRLSPLAKELGKRHPFELLEEEVFVGLMRTSDCLVRGFDGLFEEHGISENLYNTLRIIVGENDILKEGVSVGLISKRLVCRQPDTSRSVDRLVRLGLATRSTCPTDARRSLVRATSRGRELLRKLKAPLQRLHREQLKGLTRSQMENLRKLLDAVRASAAS